jgi:hypothetical protein
MARFFFLRWTMVFFLHVGETPPPDRGTLHRLAGIVSAMSGGVMSHIDEWEVLRLELPDPNAVPPTTGQQSRGKAPLAPASALARDIDARLDQLKPAPAIVHFYRGEGLRWIRIGYGGEVPITLAMVVQAGQAIEAGLAHASQKFYFHAMRPHDALFFIEGDQSDADGLGMPARFYGAPFGEVLKAWGVATVQAADNAPPGPGRPGKAAARSRAGKAPPA